MIDFLREWIISIAIVALGSSIATVLMPKGKLTAILKLCTSIAMAITLLSPIGNFVTEDYAISMARYRELIQSYEQKGSEAADRLSRTIIESECAAYIWDKGQNLGLIIGTVEVLAKWGDGVWYPFEVKIDSDYSQELMKIIELELGVPEERTQWSDEYTE